MATTNKQKNGDGKDNSPDTVKAPPMTREEASGNISSRTFLPNISLQYILLFFSFSSLPPPFSLHFFPLSLLPPYTHVCDSMVLQGIAQIQCASSNRLGQTPSTHDISVEFNRVCPPFAPCPLPLAFSLSSVFCMLSAIYLLSTSCEPVTVVCISYVLITTT